MNEAAENNKIGVLISNLGTPDAPDTRAVRRYLAEFLSDPRVVEIPRALWMLILHGYILRTRPQKSAEAYRKVWTDEGSPLLVIARKQHEALQQRLNKTYNGQVVVKLAMRYGAPSIKDVIAELSAESIRKIFVLPLYPQYSASTGGSTFDAVTRQLRQWRWVPRFRMVNDYHDNGGYIDALANSIEAHWQDNRRPDRLLFSFHGLPDRTRALGDPYFDQCHQTARLLAKRLGLEKGDWHVSFQSRLGRAEWLKPYTDVTLREWGQQGIKKVDVVCPGFSADCLETLEEIAIQNKEFFIDSGGQEFHYIPALNDRPDHMNALCGLIENNIQDWLAQTPESSAEKVVQFKK